MISSRCRNAVQSSESMLNTIGSRHMRNDLSPSCLTCELAECVLDTDSLTRTDLTAQQTLVPADHQLAAQQLVH